jgi:DNA-binding MarR family transcriptional regulator
LDAVKRLQLAVRVVADAKLSDRGLTWTQASALRALADAGSLPCATLARRLGITRQSMQELVTTLHAQGLLTKASDPDDARHIVVDLSSAGMKAERDAKDVMHELEALMAGDMAPAERENLLLRLRMCLDNLEDGVAGRALKGEV